MKNNKVYYLTGSQSGLGESADVTRDMKAMIEQASLDDTRAIAVMVFGEAETSFCFAAGPDLRIMREMPGLLRNIAERVEKEWPAAR